MSNASKDLPVDEFKGYVKLIVDRFGARWNTVTIGDQSGRVCLFHFTPMRSYSINGVWHDDLCYPCFSKDVASGKGKRAPFRVRE